MFFAFMFFIAGCDTCDEVEVSSATIFSEGVVGFFYFPDSNDYYFDLGTGTLTIDDETPYSDFVITLNPSGWETMYALNGSTLFKLGDVGFDSITYSDLESYTYSSSGFQLYIGPWEYPVFEASVVIAAKTSTGRYSKFLFYVKDMNATIHWVTYNLQ